MPEFSSLNFVIIGSAGIVQCIFDEPNLKNFEKFGLFHPLQRMVEVWVHQDAICRTFNMIGKRKIEEIYEARAKKSVAKDLVDIKLQAETTLDRFLRISDYYLRVESDELSKIVEKKWGINDLLGDLKDRLEDLAELGLALNSIFQEKIFSQISVLIAILGLAGITSSIGYMIVSGELPLEKLGIFLILTFFPVFLAMTIILLIIRKRTMMEL